MNLQFHQGGALDDPTRLLEGSGRSMRHLKLKAAGDLKQEGLSALIRGAAKAA